MVKNTKAELCWQKPMVKQNTTQYTKLEHHAQSCLIFMCVYDFVVHDFAKESDIISVISLAYNPLINLFYSHLSLCIPLIVLW